MSEEEKMSDEEFMKRVTSTTNSVEAVFKSLATLGVSGQAISTLAGMDIPNDVSYENKENIASAMEAIGATCDTIRSNIVALSKGIAEATVAVTEVMK